MAKGKKGKDSAPAKAPKAKRRKPPLVDRVTRLVLVLFLLSLAAPHVVPV